MMRPTRNATAGTTTASAIVSHLSISGVAAGNFGPFLPLAPADTAMQERDAALLASAPLSLQQARALLTQGA